MTTQRYIHSISLEWPSKRNGIRETSDWDSVIRLVPITIELYFLFPQCCTLTFGYTIHCNQFLEDALCSHVAAAQSILIAFTTSIEKEHYATTEYDA